ncbi:unnamed protein product [Larinioides sclopetarius]|uniref:Uncharacterized protein n=2 Tax=Larinioides sclopetarius TaxID=280406 RepID=A0AAV1Z757_9ARAC
MWRRSFQNCSFIQHRNSNICQKMEHYTPKRMCEEIWDGTAQGIFSSERLECLQLILDAVTPSNC